MTGPSPARTVAALALACAAAGVGCGGQEGPSMEELTTPGVPRELARWRAGSIDSLRYDLTFRVPAERSEPIAGTVRIRFRLSSERRPVVLDFAAPDPAVRDSFFASLAEPASRRHERWVVEGLGWLHHPLREGGSRRYVEPALELLEEVQATGDIFFPARWLDATLSGHTSSEVAGTVREFLASRPDYTGFLEDKILQAADPVFRAARIQGGD